MKTEKDLKEEENLVCEEISREHVVQDRWIDIRRSAFRFPDGRVFAPYYTYSKRDYAVIVARTEDGEFLCVRQFRHGIMEVTTEFPAGGIEGKDGSSSCDRRDPEQALAAARRELREETGYESETWTHLLTVPSHATLSDNYAYLFLAERCRRTSDQKLDEMELLSVQKLRGGEINELIRKEQFQQAMHVMAWLMAKERS